MNYQAEREEFVYLMARRTVAPCLSLGACRNILRLANTVQRHAVNLCNVPDYQPIFDKAMETVRRRMTEILETTGIVADLSGDPRGAVVKLILPGMDRSESASSQWIGVPTRPY